MATPANKWKLGSVSLCEWHNTTQTGKTIANYQLQRSYKSGEEWKTTDNLNLSDIPVAIELLTLALKDAKIKAETDSNNVPF